MLRTAKDTHLREHKNYSFDITFYCVRIDSTNRKQQNLQCSIIQGVEK